MRVSWVHIGTLLCSVGMMGDVGDGVCVCVFLAWVTQLMWLEALWVEQEAGQPAGRRGEGPARVEQQQGRDL